ncbi:MAG: class I SAM-dependent methyltransferase [Paracoccaceae bacterium]
MISFEDLAVAAEAPEITALDIAAFGADDIVNLILQRSEIIADQPRPGKIVGAWSEGDDGPARDLVDRMGEVLARRAAAVIWLEYQRLKPLLARLSPRSIADIGCGYAIFDLFFWRDFPGRVVLIDLEQSEDRHFGYRETGAAYSSLSVARAFLKANGVKAGQITAINPERKDPASIRPVDLAVSFLSCGFHYPIETYLEFFRTAVVPDGAVIVDFRARKARAGAEILGAMGEVALVEHSASGNGRRLLLRKGVRRAPKSVRAGGS